jgi:ATP-dependent Lon protease
MVMATFMQPDDNNEEIVAKIPSELPILPLRNTVAYPFSVLPLMVGVPRSVKLIEDALEGDRIIGLLTMKDPSIEEPQPGQIYEIGTVAKVYRVSKAPDDTLQVIVHGLERFGIEHWLEPSPYLRASIALKPDVIEPGLELDALQRSLRDLAQVPGCRQCTIGNGKGPAGVGNGQRQRKITGPRCTPIP